MTTELKRFTEAYATLTFATYEPLIVRWYSRLMFSSIADAYVKRSVPGTKTKTPAPKSKAGGSQSRLESAAETVARSRSLSRSMGFAEGEMINAMSLGMRDNPLFQLYPGLEIEDGVVYPGGRMLVDDKNPRRMEAPPILYGTGAPRTMGALNSARATKDLVGAFDKEVTNWLETHTGTIPGSELKTMLESEALKMVKKYGNEVKGPVKWPIGEWQEFLSPVGLAHFYRQLYFYVSEGVGPIEQAFTVAPAETLEIVTESVRRQSHEEVYEHGSETVSETAIESRNTDEVSDKVASMVQRDMSMGMSSSANFSAGGSVGVYNVSGSASVGLNSNFGSSSQSSSEVARRTLKELTNRAAERITKTFSVRVRDTTDYTTTNIQRRVIKNDTDKPVNYGLRRVFSRIRVKVQRLGPRLVWQLYVSYPGRGLARSRFVHFLESQTVTVPSDPPAIRSRPAGGLDGGNVSAQLKLDNNKPPNDPMRYYVTLSIQVPPDRQIVAVSIESISDMENLGKEDYAPSATGGSRPGTLSNGVYKVDLGVYPGNAESVSVTYQYRYEPSASALQDWQAEYDAAMDKFRQQEAAERQKALEEQFQRSKQLITEKSRIRSRPSADLRKEERYEILGRMVSHLFKPAGNASPGAPAPLEIELFHRYFDLDGMFFYVHPSWWVPRYAGKETGFGRPAYEITAESEPARLGRSLGWMMQLDGDDRRNEFINSPWVRVCLPMRPGREKEAVEWLAAHIEGEAGYDPKKEPLKGLLADIAKVRDNENAVLAKGPDYVDANTIVVSSTTGAPSGPLKPSDVYPVIDEFEVTIPTEGFVYDDLTVKIP